VTLDLVLLKNFKIAKKRPDIFQKEVAKSTQMRVLLFFENISLEQTSLQKTQALFFFFKKELLKF
jgi:hypothetical protein